MERGWGMMIPQMCPPPTPVVNHCSHFLNKQVLLAFQPACCAMFRKKQDTAERSRSLLKNSAAKKLKVEILAALPTLTKDIIDLLFPNKARCSLCRAHPQPLPQQCV